MTLVTRSAALKSPDCESAQDTGAGKDPRSWMAQHALQGRIADKIADARKSISEILGGLLSTHLGSGSLRNGTVLRDCIEAMSAQTSRLVDDIFDDMGALPRTPALFQEIREGIVLYIEFLDSELDRSSQRVERELEHANGRSTITAAARNLWSEKRNQLIDRLELRIEQASTTAQDPGVGEVDEPCVAEPAAFAPPMGDLPEPGFELVTQAATIAPSSSMKDLALGGQRVQHVRFAPEPEAAPDSEPNPQVSGKVLDAWADLVVGLCNGGARPGKLPEWREAFAGACERNGLQADPATIEGWANLVWRKLVTSRFVLSEVGKDIRRASENAADGSDAALSSYLEPQLSSGSAGGFGKPLDRGLSAVSFTGTDGLGGPNAAPDGFEDLSTKVRLAVPMIEIG